MSNTIGFGKIYETTWWGIGVNTNTISWGKIYGNLAGFPEFIDLFKARVEADGGEVVSLRCVIDKLQVVSQPVITLLGSNPAYVDINNTYTDAGATANDEIIYGDLTSSITSKITVDNKNAGVYKVDYEVVDPSNRTAIANRKVFVLSELASDYRDRVLLDNGTVEKIECTEFNYNVNWGYYLGLQSGFDRFLTEYQTRITTDAGTLENLNCVRNSYLSNYDWTYNYRVIDDLGTVESLGCININELIYK